MTDITRAIPLKKSKMCEEWDVCIDGVWYAAEWEGSDSSDIAMLKEIIEKNNLPIENIPLWNSSQTKDYEKIVYIPSSINYGDAYLVRTK